MGFPEIFTGEAFKMGKDFDVFSEKAVFFEIRPGIFSRTYIFLRSGGASITFSHWLSMKNSFCGVPLAQKPIGEIRISLEIFAGVKISEGGQRYRKIVVWLTLEP